VILDKHWVESVDYYESILGFADTHFDTVQSELAQWIRGWSKTQERELMPSVINGLFRHGEPIKDKDGLATRIEKWKDHSKISRLSRIVQSTDPADLKMLWSSWKKSRFSSGKDLFAPLNEVRGWCKTKSISDQRQQLDFFLHLWWRKETHLINWARHQQLKLIRSRNQIYRNKAIEWAKVYGKVVIEKWDKRITAEIPKYESDKRSKQEENASSLRHLVAVSIMTQVLLEKFRKNLSEENAANISSDHFGCKSKKKVASKLKVITPTPQRKCSRCDRMYDQDVNAAMHLWHRAFDGGIDKENAA
jgi:hypothetical protein